MAIGDSDVVFYAAGLSNATPFVPSGLDANLTEIGVGCIVSSESWRPYNTGSTLGGFVYAVDPEAGAVTAVMRMATGLSAGRFATICLLDSSGNGWGARVNYGEYRVFPITAYALGSQVTFESPGSPAAGDEYSITIDGTALTTQKNGSPVGSYTVTAGTYRIALLLSIGEAAMAIDAFGGNGFAAAGPAINPTGTDTDLVNGTSASVVFSGLTSDPASIEVVWDNGVDSAISSTQADFSLGTVTDGVATATVTATIGNLPYTDATYLTADYSYLVTCDDDSEITLDTLTMSPEAGRDFITLASPLNDSTSIIPSETLATGEQIEFPTTVSGDTFTVNADGSFNVVYAGSPQELTFNLGYWDGSTWYTIATTLNISGEVVSGGGLTRVGLTRAGLTTAGLTAVGL